MQLVTRGELVKAYEKTTPSSEKALGFFVTANTEKSSEQEWT